MSLTDRAIRSVKPGKTVIKLFDERGLFLLVTPKGSKLWRAKYFFNKKEQLLSLGRYPEVSLAEARERRDTLRKQVADGRNPATIRKASRGAIGPDFPPTFLSVATEWFEQRKSVWAIDHGNRLWNRLDRHVFPWVGSRPINEMTTAELLPVLRRIQDRGTIETAHRALNSCSQIFRFAVATSRASIDITQHLRGALPPAVKRHRASTVEPARLAPLLRMLRAYPGSLIVRTAIQFGLLTFTRPGELRTAKWADIDFQSCVWTFVASKTKTSLVVPLAEQSIQLLLELKPLTEDSEYVFPCARTPKKPMSNNAVLAAMRSLHIGKDELCGHGFRAIATPLICEQLGIRAELVEHQLGHAVRGPLGRAYDRTEFLAERRAMMQQWADYLDQLAESHSSNVAILRYV